MWTDPPVFVEDGLPLEADPLNALSDNAAWLYNQVRRMVPAMPVYRVEWDNEIWKAQVQAQWRIRHVGRYLKARIYATLTSFPSQVDNPPWWKIYYDGRLILEDAWPMSPLNTSRRHSKDYDIDLQAVLPGLVVGTRYQIAVTCGNPPEWGGEFEFTYAYETEMVE